MRFNEGVPVTGYTFSIKYFKTNIMNRLSKRHFWEWFKRHNHEYIALQNKTKKEIRYWLNELNAHLRAYYKFLGFSLENKDNTATLTINVEGNATHFKKAEDLVAKAPLIRGWTIKALEDPRPIDFLLEKQMQETCIDPREMYFSFLIDEPHHKFLIVYHHLCTPENQNSVYELANAAVYNLLGERSYGSN